MAHSPPKIQKPKGDFTYKQGVTTFDELAKLTKGMLIKVAWDNGILPPGHKGDQWSKSELATALRDGVKLVQMPSEAEGSAEVDVKSNVVEAPVAVCPPSVARKTVQEFVRDEGTLLADYGAKFPLLTSIAEDVVARLSFPVDVLSVVALFAKVLQDCRNPENAAVVHATMKRQPTFAYRRQNIVLHREAHNMFGNELERGQVSELVTRVADVVREHPDTAEEVVAKLAPELALLKGE